MMEKRAPVLEMRSITKRFPGVLANDQVDLELHPGEVLALLGENGAGKSTLLHVLVGLYRQDEGEVYVRGERVEIAARGFLLKSFQTTVLSFLQNKFKDVILVIRIGATDGAEAQIVKLQAAVGQRDNAVVTIGKPA